MQPNMLGKVCHEAPVLMFLKRNTPFPSLTRPFPLIPVVAWMTSEAQILGQPSPFATNQQQKKVSNIHSEKCYLIRKWWSTHNHTTVMFDIKLKKKKRHQYKIDLVIFPPQHTKTAVLNIWKIYVIYLFIHFSSLKKMHEPRTCYCE